MCGIASADFLVALDAVTALRSGHAHLVYALPLAGLLVGALYERWGEPIRRGHDLVIDTLHDDGPPIPLRMAPMVLVGTLLTHLFGGSAGREGTAVQMGASLADAIAQRLRLASIDRRTLIVSGIAGGFASVFGTPIAGALFAIELGTVRRFELRAMVPSLVAAFVGDRVTRALGVQHTHYPQPAALALSWPVIGKWIVVALALAVAAIVFITLVHGMKGTLAKIIPRLPLRMALGGGVVVALFVIAGTDRYLGLGVPTIVASFTQVPTFAFAWKLAFTTVTLGSGYLGGEVTPLFFIGATLAATVGTSLGLPQAMAAGVGLAALFGAAANTPIALSIMAVELLGVNVWPHVFLVTLVAYALTGRRGLYAAQRRPA